MITQAFLYNAIFFTESLVLTRFFNVPSGQVAYLTTRRDRRDRRTADGHLRHRLRSPLRKDGADLMRVLGRGMGVGWSQ
jgi:hypothetical protein